MNENAERILDELITSCFTEAFMSLFDFDYRQRSKSSIVTSQRAPELRSSGTTFLRSQPDAFLAPFEMELLPS